jgi:hypothetical protein
METLSKMFNAMEQRYVSYALDEYNPESNPGPEDGTNLVEDVLKADEADSKVFALLPYFWMLQKINVEHLLRCQEKKTFLIMPSINKF